MITARHGLDLPNETFDVALYDDIRDSEAATVWTPATIVGTGRDADALVLELQEPTASRYAEQDPVPFVIFLDQIGIKAWAVGFPDFAVVESPGSTSTPARQQKRGVTVETTPLPGHQARSKGADQRIRLLRGTSVAPASWAGFSGAGVLLGGEFYMGLVCAHDSGVSECEFDVCSTSRLYDDESLLGLASRVLPSKTELFMVTEFVATFTPQLRHILPHQREAALKTAFERALGRYQYGFDDVAVDLGRLMPHLLRYDVANGGGPHGA